LSFAFGVIWHFVPSFTSCHFASRHLALRAVIYCHMAAPSLLVIDWFTIE